MDLILIRHGESQANLNRTYGLKDTPLTEKGIIQAKRTGENMDGLEGKNLYMSPYKRAKDTAEYLGLEGEIREELRELDFGVLKGRSYDYLEENYPDEAKKLMDDPMNFIYPDGEGIDDIYGRIGRFIDELILKDEDAILVCHDGTIKAILSYILEDKEMFFKFKVDNVGASRISIDDGYRSFKYINRIYY